MAENDCTPHEIAAVSGHASLKEVERYTKAAYRKRLAARAQAGGIQLRPRVEVESADTALELAACARADGFAVRFVATGQTGMLVAGGGITIDRIPVGASPASPLAVAKGRGDAGVAPTTTAVRS